MGKAATGRASSKANDGGANASAGGIDARFLQADGRVLLSGAEAIVKGALETPGGVHLFTGCPAAPIAGVFDTLRHLTPLLTTHGQEAQLATTESLAAAMAHGIQLARGRALVALSSGGFQKAGEALALGSLAGPGGDHSDTSTAEGGAVIVVGEDVWGESVPSMGDSRLLAEQLHLPVLEPSDLDDLKNGVAAGYALGAAGRSYVALLAPTLLAEGGAAVACRPNEFPRAHHLRPRTLHAARDLDPQLNQRVLLPHRVAYRRQQQQRCYPQLWSAARRLGVNRILHPTQRGQTAAIGFISTGVACDHLCAALTEMNLLGRLPILKLGLSWPLDRALVSEFAAGCRTLIVVEERRAFVERQVRDFLAADPAAPPVFGKRLPPPDVTDDAAASNWGLPDNEPLHPSLLIERLTPVLRRLGNLPPELTNGSLDALLTRITAARQRHLQLPTRTPTFCAGCPHRDSASVLLELKRDLADHRYMLRKHKRKPVDLVFHGDAGCASLLGFEPNRLLQHDYAGLGLAGGAGDGAAPFIDNQQVIFMGDGAFFAGGQLALAQSIAAGRNVTYLILDNGAAALSGQHPTLGAGVDLMGRSTRAQQIERVIEGMLPRKLPRDVRLARLNPEDRPRYRTLLEQVFLADGIKIVIADKQCAIIRHRAGSAARQREYEERGFHRRQTHMNIASDVCDFCQACTTATGCPGLMLEKSDRGVRVQTDLGACIEDKACQRVGACPAFEQVEVLRAHRPLPALLNTPLPEAPRPRHADQPVWRCLVAGAGGMGVNVLTRVLATAGQHMGYDVQYALHKGVAVRTGGVYSELVFGQRASGRHVGATIPWGDADLLMGLDLLEAARGIDAAGPFRAVTPQRTAAVLNDALAPTTRQLIGVDDFDPDHLRRMLMRHVRDDAHLLADFTTTCRQVLEETRFANMMALGAAFQRGFVPLTLQAIEQAIWSVLQHDALRNLHAFQLGRLLAVDARHLPQARPFRDDAPVRTLRRRAELLRRHGAGGWSTRRARQRLAQQFRALVIGVYRRAVGLSAHDPLLREITMAVYDCLLWGGLDYAKRYCALLKSVLVRDDRAQGYALTRAAARGLAHAMLVRDEVFVAQLLTRPEKYAYDAQRFHIDPRTGDRLRYRHYVRAEVELLGRRLGFDCRLRPWQLRLVAAQRWWRWLPGYHRKGFRFRDWYEKLVRRLDWSAEKGAQEYQRWRLVLGSPHQVTGYRDLRLAHMQNAQRQVQHWLEMDASQFDIAPLPREADFTVADERRVSLPVLPRQPEPARL